MILFDKNGNCGTFFEYKASRHEIGKEKIKADLGKQSEDDVREILRRAVVMGALHGKCVVLDLGKVSPNILAS